MLNQNQKIQWQVFQNLVFVLHLSVIMNTKIIFEVNINMKVNVIENGTLKNVISILIDFIITKIP